MQRKIHFENGILDICFEQLRFNMIKENKKFKKKRVSFRQNDSE